MRTAGLLFVLTLGLSQAQERQEILDYPLTMQRANQLIAALPQMTKYVTSLPPEVLKKAAKQTRAERLANLDRTRKEWPF